MNITSLVLGTAISGKFRIGAAIVLAVAILLFMAAIVRGAGTHPPRKLRWYEKLCYAAILVGTLGLALTGLGMTMGLGEHLTGWTLMVHATVAPLFAIGLAGFAMSAADRFAPNCRTCGSDKCGDGGHCNCCSVSVCFFWLSLVAGLVLMLSAALPMLPIFDTPGLELSLLIHRYAGLAFVVLIIPHAGRVLRGA